MAAVSRRYSLPVHTPPSPQRPGLSNRRRCKTVTAALTRRDLLAATSVSSVLTLPNGALAAPASLYDFSALQYEKPVNYPGLRALTEKYGKDGFRVIAFPCNQFGGQAPGTSEEERAFAIKKFGIQSLPVMDKVDVNGPSTHPVYKFLKAETNTSKVPWNYWKALVDRSGQPVKSFGPSFDPLGFEGDVRLLLAGKDATPSECALHPGRIVCQVERLLSA